MRWRGLTWWSGRRTSDSIADLWSLSLTTQNPPIPNLPLETPSAGGVTGTLSITLAAATLSGSGVVAVSGAAAVSLSPATLVATGAVAVSGSASISLAPATLAGTGGVAVEGQGSVTLGAVTLTATGTVSGGTPSTVRRFYRGHPRVAGAVMLSRSYYYVDEAA